MRIRHAGLVVLGAVIIAVLGLAPAATAQCGAGGGQLGPCPALIDTNRNGRPDPGVDQAITFDFQPDGSVLTINNPWTTRCGDNGGNTVSFNHMDPNSPGFDHATRNLPSEMSQTMQVTGYDSHGDPIQFAFNEWPSYKMGTASLIDDNSDGLYDHLRAMAGSAVYFDLSFQGVSTLNNGAAQYATVPWSQANLLGMNGTCALPGGDPQIFVPVVGNRISIGFPGFQPSPPLSLALLPTADPVPTLSEWGALILLLGLGFVGWRALRRSRALA